MRSPRPGLRLKQGALNIASCPPTALTEHKGSKSTLWIHNKPLLERQTGNPRPPRPLGDGRWEKTTCTMMGRAGILSETLLPGVTKSVSLVSIQNSPMRNQGEAKDIRMFTWAWPQAGSLPSAPARVSHALRWVQGQRSPSQGRARAGKAQGQLPGPALGMGKEQLTSPGDPRLSVPAE